MMGQLVSHPFFQVRVSQGHRRCEPRRSSGFEAKKEAKNRWRGGAFSQENHSEDEESKGVAVIEQSLRIKRCPELFGGRIRVLLF